MQGNTQKKYIHTYIHPGRADRGIYTESQDTHTYITAYINTEKHTCMHTYRRAGRHTYKQTNIHT